MLDKENLIKLIGGHRCTGMYRIIGFGPEFWQHVQILFFAKFKVFQENVPCALRTEFDYLLYHTLLAILPW